MCNAIERLTTKGGAFAKMELMQRLNRQLLGLAMVLTLALPVLSASKPRAMGQESVQLPQNAGELVRSVIKHELNANQNRGLSAWTERDIKPHGTYVKLYVETPEGLLGRVVAKNGQTLTPEERKKEDDRNNRLLNPKEWKAKQKEQREDEARTLKMLAAIPDAFNFQYVNTERAQNGHSIVKMNFTPNPNFDPPSREALVFEAMSGIITVDASAHRIVRIDGTLFKDISIGWGIIGHLDKGGRFYVEQAEVYPGHWDQTRMILDFTGKALLFKNIRIKDDSTAYDFRPVDPMNVAQALNFLRQQNQTSGGVTSAQAAR